MIDPQETPGPLPPRAVTLADVYSEIRQANRRLGVIETRLMGPPEEPEKGLVVRVDRIEQAAARRDKITWAVAVGVLGALGKFLWDFVTGANHSAS